MHAALAHVQRLTVIRYRSRAATIVMLGAGGAMTHVGPWYRNLRKPSWNPPDWLFGPAWALILGLDA